MSHIFPQEQRDTEIFAGPERDPFKGHYLPMVNGRMERLVVLEGVCRQAIGL